MIKSLKRSLLGTYLTLPLMITIATRTMYKGGKKVVEKGVECIGKACNETSKSMSTTANSVAVNTAVNSKTTQQPTSPVQLSTETSSTTTGVNTIDKANVAQSSFKEQEFIIYRADVQHAVQKGSASSSNLSELDKAKQAMKDNSWFTMEGQDSSEGSDSKSHSTEPSFEEA
jgi:hypothetical protein